MTVFMWLLFGHILADFYLQPTRWVREREARRLRAWALYQHCFVHLLVTAGVLLLCVALRQLSISWNLVWAVLAITVSHVVIDAIKSYVAPSARALVLDQLAHVIILVVVWGWLTGLFPFVQMWTFGFLMQPEKLILVCAYLLAARPVSFFTAAVLRRQALALSGSAQGLIEAGRMIGYVERWLIISFVLSGHFVGVGFLLAAKSIFRFGDLSHAHERRLTEYMLLGTLVSFTSALAIASGAAWVLG